MYEVVGVNCFFKQVESPNQPAYNLNIPELSIDAQFRFLFVLCYSSINGDHDHDRPVYGYLLRQKLYDGDDNNDRYVRDVRGNNDLHNRM